MSTIEQTPSASMARNAGTIFSKRPGHLKPRRRPVCNDCGVGINLDTGKRALAAAALREAIETVPAEITIKFFRPAL